MCNMATDLFLHKKIVTTEAKAKELRPFAEALITRARIALRNEQNGVLPNSRPNKNGEVIKSTTDFNQRRQVGRFIKNKAVLQELFDTIAPAVLTRDGGYTRIIKLGPRRGDGGKEAIIELVDFALPQDGVVRLKKKQSARPMKATTKSAIITSAVAPITAEEVEEEIAEVIEMSTDTIVEEVETASEESLAEDIPQEEISSEDKKEESAE
jgi:large subunit ribosomal protein L17